MPAAHATKPRPGSAITAVAVALPMVVVLGAIALGATGADAELWAHLREHVLARVMANTAILVVGVVTIAVLLGTSLAWLTAACDFPGRGFFSWALLLPMAMPAYVLAFVAVATLDYAGAVPVALRAWFGTGFAVPPIRSTGGVIAVLGLASYPYVYLMARGAFLTHGARVLEAAQSLGLGPWAGLFRVAVPLARPWLAGGAALVAMETLADFGAVSVFNYDTFTTAIYKSWYGLFSIETALALALLLLAFVATALAAERLARGRGRHTAADSGARSAARLTLPGARGWLACAFATTVFALGFALPAIALARWAIDVAPLDLDARYFSYIFRTLSLAAMAASACLALAVTLGYATRVSSSAVAARHRGSRHSATRYQAQFLPWEWSAHLALQTQPCARSRATRACGSREPFSRFSLAMSRVSSRSRTALSWAASRASGPRLRKRRARLASPRERLSRACTCRCLAPGSARPSCLSSWTS